MARSTFGFFVGSVVLGVAVFAQASDQIQVEGLPPQPVTIRGFQDGKLSYITVHGDPGTRDYDRLKMLVVDGDPAFNAAEASFAAGDKENAVDGYVKTIRGASKPWEKAFAARRLLDSIGSVKRFDAQLAAYMALLVTDPTSASLHKPVLPEKGNAYLDKAVGDIDQVLQTPKLSDAQQLALLNLEVEIQRKRGDDAGITATLERMTRLGGDAANDPAVQAQLAALKVNQAKLALDQKNYSQAEKLINDNRQFISDPVAQSDALFVLARCKLAQTDKTDKPAMKDAALAFMKVVANFDDTDGKPNVLASLQATAGILEDIGEKDAAINLYNQVADEFPGDAATAAKSKIDQLKKG